MFCVVISQVPPGSRERHGQGPGHDTPSSPRRPLCPGPGACQASVSRGALAPADDRARALAARESGVASKGTRHRRMRGTGKQIDATVSLRSRHPPARAGWEASAPAGRGASSRDPFNGSDRVQTRLAVGFQRAFRAVPPLAGARGEEPVAVRLAPSAARPRPNSSRAARPPSRGVTPNARASSARRARSPGARRGISSPSPLPGPSARRMRHGAPTPDSGSIKRPWRRRRRSAEAGGDDDPSSGCRNAKRGLSP